MHKDKFVFSQLVALDRNKFNYIVRKYDGDKYVKISLLESAHRIDVWAVSIEKV